MTWRKITSEDYSLLCDWWTKRGWENIPITMLTSEGIMIVSEKGNPIFAGFLLIHGTDLVFLEWVVSNPNVEKEERSGGFDKLLEVAEILTKDRGGKYLMHMTNNQKLVEMFKSKNYTVTDENCVHLIKQV